MAVERESIYECRQYGSQIIAKKTGETNHDGMS